MFSNSARSLSPVAGPIIVLVSGVGAAIAFSHGLDVTALLVSVGILVALLFPPPALLGLLFVCLLLGSSRYLSSELYFIRFGVLALVAARGLADFLTAYRAPRAKLPRSVIVLLVLFGLLGLASAVYSPVPGVTLQRGLSWLLMILAVGLYLSLYVGTKEDAERIPLVFLYVAIGAVLVSLGAWLVEGPAALHARGFRGIFGNPNTLGSVLTLAVVPALWRFHITRNLCWGVAILILGLGLILSESRSAFLAVGVSLVVYYALRGLRGRAAVAGLSVSIFSTAVVIGASSAVVLSSGRTAAWSATVDLILEHPLSGYGFGTVEDVLPWRFPEYIANVFQGANPHNSYLDVAVELGIPGLAIVSAAIILTLWGVYHTLVTKRELMGWQEPFLVMLVATIVGALVHASLEAWLTSVGSVVAVPFWTFLLLTAVSIRPALNGRYYTE